MTEGYDIEQGRGHRKAREPDENDRDHGVPDEYHIAPEGRADVFAFDHGLKLRGRELVTGQATLSAMNHPAHILYVKNCVRSATAAHGSHEFGAKKQPGALRHPGAVAILKSL